MMHATECALWKSISGVESLKASLARQNPNRLYLWEGIANGFNWYYQHCQQAKTDRHMRFCFVGFWANPTYSIAKDDPDYKTYWDGHLTDEEVNRARFVRQNYNVTVQPEQIAWWRRESEYKADEYMLRHYPWTETECFIASGTGFFPAKKTLEIGEQLAAGPPYKGYRYTFQEEFIASRIEQVTDGRRKEEVQLKIWEPPEPDGHYAIGVDPSGGGGGDANDHAIEILRCYADRCIQVAEFRTNAPSTYQLAWVLCHLCGAYKTHICNLEITGVGGAVMPEIRNLRQLAQHGIIQAEAGGDPILSMIGSIRWYLYKRPDTLGGVGNVTNWKTNADNKQQVYSELRDSILKGTIEFRSIKLIQELQAIVEDQGWLGAGPDTGENDDLVSAMTLAHHAWVEQLQPNLIARKLTWEKVKGTHPPATPGTVLSFAFSEKMRQIHRKSNERRQKF
jgi:hypothetical protein